MSKWASFLEALGQISRDGEWIYPSLLNLYLIQSSSSVLIFDYICPKYRKALVFSIVSNIISFKFIVFYVLMYFKVNYNKIFHFQH